MYFIGILFNRQTLYTFPKGKANEKGVKNKFLKISFWKQNFRNILVAVKKIGRKNPRKNARGKRLYSIRPSK